ncbi:MAG: hypothetical protein KDA27_26995 [Candidatus Eisenbacteria bacterium]|uniref:Uncharacterized protein n=1 Tax=Eiseniibacteriota bacterium TaxID=2212470 RepID=A0A956SGP0_UNCEI|nr:hypothetical protein [Candidatus Eisenbacteria bacterium]
MKTNMTTLFWSGLAAGWPQILRRDQGSVAKDALAVRSLSRLSLPVSLFPGRLLHQLSLPGLLLPALLLQLFLLSGCSDDYAGEEWRLGEEDKIRALGVVIEPPEAAPGETVDVTLHWYDPRPAATQIDWQVALEFDPGNYGVDPVERRFVDLNGAGVPKSTTDSGDGFFTQTFSFQVPDSVLVWSPAVSTLMQADEVEVVAEAFAEWADPTPAGWNAFLSSLTAEDLASMDPESADVIRSISDLFAAQIRFHASIEHGSTVEATRTLTVRYSSALGSKNVNENTEVASLYLVGIPGYDVVWSERDEYEGRMKWTEVAIDDEVHASVSDSLQGGWTYYLVCDGLAQSYGSPYADGAELEELIGYRWFRFRAADPTSDQPFFVTDMGDDADVYDLDEAVRIEPSKGERYRVCVVLRDERPEWARYQASPGQRVVLADILFE